MDDLKEGIGLRAYGQKDPLLEYKGEAFKLFVQLLDILRNEIVSFCFKFFPQAQEDVQQRARREQRMTAIKDSATNIGLSASASAPEELITNFIIELKKRFSVNSIEDDSIKENVIFNIPNHYKKVS